MAIAVRRHDMFVGDSGLACANLAIIAAVRGRNPMLKPAAATAASP